MKLSNETYDTLKWIALTGLPHLITFYGVLGSALNIPYTKEVLTVASAFDAMLGAWLGVQSKNYKQIDDVDLKG